MYRVITFIVTILIVGGMAGVIHSDDKQSSDVSEQDWQPLRLIIKTSDIGLGILDVKMIGQTFRIPINRLDTILEQHRYARDEITGFSVAGLWPDLQPPSETNLDEFVGMNGVNKDVINIRVRRACHLLPPSSSSSIVECDPHTRINYLVDQLKHPIGKNEFIPSESVSGANVRQMPGMQFMGIVDSLRNGTFRLGDPYEVRPQEPLYNLPEVFDKDVYGTLLGGSFTQVSSCLRRDYGPSCVVDFLWRDKFEIKVRFSVQHLHGWQIIKRQVVQLLATLVVDENVAPPTNQHWAQFPPSGSSN